jgi:two-component system nitrogen regulation response regulator GlnG
VSEGDFREDLLYRLRVVPIHIPALCERRDDIRTLAQHFTHRYSAELCESDIGLAEASLDVLQAYDWPGNVRELENAIKRALVLASTNVLSPDDFQFLEETRPSQQEGATLRELVQREVHAALGEPDSSEIHRRMLERVEQPLIETVLSHTEGNQIRAAALLGINRNTLRKKIVELEIELPIRRRA